jgi:hypothetical protein
MANKLYETVKTWSNIYFYITENIFVVNVLTKFDIEKIKKNKNKNKNDTVTFRFVILYFNSKIINQN